MSGMSFSSKRRCIVLRRFLTASAALLVLPSVAQAQSVNHRELEQLFGEPVTTSVTGKPQRASETSAALIIITRDDIRRSPANDIPGLLQAYAGIDVVRWTSRQSDVFIRGGVRPFNPSLLVLVNGRQVYLDFYGMANWNGLGIQLEEIQQIEVVKGPNSALFGFNAASGVINIITDNPLQTQQASVTVEAGTHGYQRVSGVAALKLNDQLGLRLSAGLERQHELAGLNTSPLAPSLRAITFDPRKEEASAELYFKPNERTEGSLSAVYSTNHQLQFAQVLLVNPAFYKFTSIGGRFSHDTGWGIVSARAFHNSSDVRTPIDASTELLFRNRVFVASTDALIRAGTSNTLRFGIEFRANELKSSPGYSGKTRYNVLAGSGMWESRLSDGATVTFAGRVDHLKLRQEGIVDQPTIFTKQDFDRSLTEWSFNGALLVKLSDTATLRVAASQGIQAPSLYSFGARLVIPIPGTPLNSVTLGDPAIQSAKVRSAEIGLTRMFDQSGSRVELTGFYNRTSKLISEGSAEPFPRFTPQGDPFLLTLARNVGSFEAYGVEASMNGRIGKNWLWDLNYTWTAIQQHITGNTGLHFEQPFAVDKATPEHKVWAQLSYDNGPWLVTVVARYTSGIQQLVAINGLGAPPSLVDVDGIAALDAKVAFRANDNLTFSLSGENLTGAAGAYLSPAPAERRLRASVQVRF